MSRFGLWTEDCELRTAFGLWTEDCGLKIAIGLWTEDCGLRTAIGLWTEDRRLKTAFGLWTEGCGLRTAFGLWAEDRRLKASFLALSIGAAFLLASCSAGDSDTAGVEVLSVVGVVIAVDGSLSGIDSFTIRVGDGTDLAFAPDDDALFENGPFSHIRDHLTSGAPIRVSYVMLDDGSNRALSAGDA